LAVESIRKQSATSGKVLVLVTDMFDNQSLGVSELYRQLRESDVKFFAVAASGKQNLFGAAKDDNGPVVKLDELTSLSGGRVLFIPDVDDLNDYFEIFALRLQHMYTIGFRPSTLETESNLYRVNIKVDPPRGLPPLTVGNDEGFLWGRKPLIVVHP
jgi:Ca-activated chloride channel homolog